MGHADERPRPPSRRRWQRVAPVGLIAFAIGCATAPAGDWNRPNGPSPAAGPITPGPAKAPDKGLLFATIGDDAGPHGLPELKLSPAEEQAALKRLFGRRLGSADQCPAGADPRTARRDGHFAPRVLTALRGAFTRPGATETLLVVHIGECGASHAENFGSTRLMALEGGRQTLDVDRSVNTVEAAKDVDGDGTLDLVLSAGAMMGGAMDMHSELVSLRDGRVRQLRDFGQTLSNDCLLPGGTTNKGVVVRVVPGATPTLDVEKVSKTCEATPGAADCAKDTSACGAPTGYCCLDAQGKGACVSGLDACESLALTCKKEEDCPEGPTGMVLMGCEGDGLKQCSYRFTKGAGAHAAEVEAHEQASKKAAEASKGDDELAAGERVAKAARDSRDQAEALRHFAKACDSGNSDGCARAAEFVINGWGTKSDAGRAIKLTARACKLGRGLSCTDDLGCVERREVAIVGRKVGRNSMRVTKSVGVETIKKCERHCASGLPGACHTAGNYQSAAGRDAEAKRSFARSCKLGNKGDCGDRPAD